MAITKRTRFEVLRRDAHDSRVRYFGEKVWPEGEPLPKDWRPSIARQFEAGLNQADLRYAVDATFGAKNPPYDVFRYFMGVCRTILMQRADVARKLLEAPDA